MSYLLKRKLKDFYKSLDEIERCVFEKLFFERNNQAKVGGICFNPPVGNTRVSQYVTRIKLKFFILVLEYDEAVVKKQMNVL